MGSDPDPGGAVIGAHVGEEEKHQQGPPAGTEIDPPLAEVVGGGDVPLGRKAAVDVPTGVAGMVGVREANDEVAEIRSSEPPPGADQLVPGPVEPLVGDGRGERSPVGG
jgi:hypothetical protein